MIPTRIRRFVKTNKVGVIAIAALSVIAITASIVALVVKKDEEETYNKVKLITSIYPITALAEQIGGVRADVETITEESANPFVYVATEEQEQMIINDADVFVYSGINLIDSWTKNLVNDLNEEKTIPVKLSSRITLLQLQKPQNTSITIAQVGDKVTYQFYAEMPTPCHQLEKSVEEKSGKLTVSLTTVQGEEETCVQVIDNRLIEDEVESDNEITQVTVKLDGNILGTKDFDNTVKPEDYDPHIWLDPVLAKEQVEAITTALISASEANSSYYQKNADDYNKKLDELNQKYLNYLSNCQSDTIAVTENAYGYLAKRYNLNTLVLSDIYDSKGSIDLNKISRISQIAEKNQLSYIFFGSEPTEEVKNALGENITALTLDSFTKNNQKGYIGTMESNLENLKIGLGCE